jgi:hypothetical protein
VKRFRGRLVKARSFSLADWRLFLEAMATIVTVHVALRMVELPRLVAWATLPSGERHAPCACADVERTATFVAMAGRVTGLQCLPRSVALTRLLARRGLTSTLRIGVRHDGETLAAHAWVEWGGRALDHDEQQLQQFSPFEGRLDGISHA